MTTPERSHEPEDKQIDNEQPAGEKRDDEGPRERRWQDNPLLVMSWDYVVLLILIVLVCLVVWWLRS